MEKFKANDTLETIKQSVLSNGTEVDGMTELKFSYTSRIRYYYENYELQVIRLETGNRDDYKIIMGFRYIDFIAQPDEKQLEENIMRKIQ